MTKTKAVIVPVTPFQQNCTLLWCEATKRAVVIDPGGDLPEVERAITRAGVSVDNIWLTHGHVDHAAGAMENNRCLSFAKHARPIEPRPSL